MSSMVMNWLTENFCAVLADVIGGFLDDIWRCGK